MLDSCFIERVRNLMLSGCDYEIAYWCVRDHMEDCARDYADQDDEE